MNEESVRKEIGIQQTQDQFGVAQTPFHTHNDIDSPKISFFDLKSRLLVLPVILAGTAPATAGNYGIFYTAPFSCRFLSVNEVHTTAGSDAGAVTVQIEKLISTTAPGSGTVLLSSGINMKGTANTVQYGTLASIQKTNFSLKKSDRLALKLTGTPTAVANAVFTVTLIF